MAKQPKRPSKLDILQLVQRAQATPSPYMPSGPAPGTGPYAPGAIAYGVDPNTGLRPSPGLQGPKPVEGPPEAAPGLPGLQGGEPWKDWSIRNGGTATTAPGYNPDGSKKEDPAAEDPMASLNALFAKLYPDETQGIRDAYGAQIGAVNSSYAAELDKLHREHGAAVNGVRREGAQLQSGLTALGQDAQIQNAADTKAVKADFATGDAATRATMDSLTKDLKNSGVNPGGLHAEALARNAAVKGMGANAAGLSGRYTQLMNQEINDRQATGQLITTGSIDDLARIMANAQADAGVSHQDALGKLYAGMAGDIASAKSDAAKAKFSLFASVLKSGGTLGAAGLKTLTPAAIKAAAGVAAGGAPKWNVAFSVINKSKDPEEVQKGALALAQISNAKDPIAEVGKVFANWMAQPQDVRDKAPHLTEALMQALGMAQYANQVKAGTGATLGITGYDIGQ